MALDWRNEFSRLLSSPDHVDWEKARTLRLENVPERLYRYRAPVETSFKSLASNTIWLSAASKLNDVHDTSVLVDAHRGFEITIRQHLAAGTLPPVFRVPAFMRSISKSMVAGLDALFSAAVKKESGSEQAEKARGFLTKFLKMHSAMMSARTSQFMQLATKIACFCESPDVPLLWAHYADSHRGFCVEYDLTDLPREDLRVHWLLPVVYTSERFSLTDLMDLLGNHPNPFLPMLAAIHKSTDWAYEREWRIVAPIGDDSAGLEWIMPPPSRLYLGHRMDPIHRSRLVQIARKQGIPLSEMTPSNEGFTLLACDVATGE